MRHLGRTLVTGFWIMYTLSVVYIISYPVLGLPRAGILLPLSTLTFFAFAVGHALDMLGTKRTAQFLLISFLVSLLFESVGVLTGLVYGPYHYGDTLGFKIFGLVPVLIPVAWFMMVYTSYVLALRLARAVAPGRSLLWDVWLSLVAAMAMTAWDLVMDPAMVLHGHWVWEVEGPYFGIPARNFFGWLATTFTIMFLYRFLVERSHPSPTREAPRAYRDLPLWAYVVTWLVNVAAAWELGLQGPAVVGFFSMGGFALLGVGLSIWGAPAGDEG